jgi:AbiV family abortive infection protein
MHVRRACLDHSRDLLAAAERVVRDEGFPNIAYHLAILALEEIGKAGMIACRAVVRGRRDIDWMDDKFGDHVWKLQWAVWSPVLSSGRIDPNDFTEARRFALSTHSRRMAGLYVKLADDGSEWTSPRDAVRLEHATSLIDLARVRLELEEARGELSMDQLNEDLEWFLNTVGEETGAKRIFSKPFIAKHEELKGDTRAWVAWARGEFGKIAAEEQAHLQRELARSPATPSASKPKWVMRIRVHTPSHSVRPKVLNYWNSRMPWIKLSAAPPKKSELLLELTLHDSISIERLYDGGLSLSKLCLAALNIGSLGFFWYELPQQTSRYFESVRDLDAPSMNVAMGRSRGLVESWEKRALSERNLRHALQCMAMFGPLSEAIAKPIFEPYLHGLALLSKSDIHLSCENLARDEFIKSLHAAVQHFGRWDGNPDTLVASVHEALEEIMPEVEHRDAVLRVVVAPHQTEEGALADAISAKRLTDLYLVLVADRLWSERISQAA